MTTILDAAIRAGCNTMRNGETNCGFSACDDCWSSQGITAALRAMFDAAERDPTALAVMDIAFCEAMAAADKDSIDQGWEAAIHALKVHVLGD